LNATAELAPWFAASGNWKMGEGGSLTLTTSGKGLDQIYCKANFRPPLGFGATIDLPEGDEPCEVGVVLMTSDGPWFAGVAIEKGAPAGEIKFVSVSSKSRYEKRRRMQEKLKTIHLRFANGLAAVDINGQTLAEYNSTYTGTDDNYMGLAATSAKPGLVIRFREPSVFRTE